MLAATGDQDLMRWLATGHCEGPLPPEAPSGSFANAEERIAAAQHRIKQRTSRRGLSVAPWPKALGTPPWTAAREARFPAVRYIHRAVDDRAERGVRMTSMLVNALRHGLPVLLYTGGDCRRGAASAMPRHVVLAVPGSQVRRTPDGDEVISVYEPGAGLVHEVRVSDLSDRSEPLPALGHWTHIQWLCLPTPSIRTNKGNQ